MKPIVSCLIRLYPRRWRERYEDEFTAMLEQYDPTWKDVINIALNVLDTRIRGDFGMLMWRILNRVRLVAVGGLMLLVVVTLLVSQMIVPARIQNEPIVGEYIGGFTADCCDDVFIIIRVGDEIQQHYINQDLVSSFDQEAFAQDVQVGETVSLVAFDSPRIQLFQTPIKPIAGIHAHGVTYMSEQTILASRFGENSSTQPLLAHIFMIGLLLIPTIFGWTQPTQKLIVG